MKRPTQVDVARLAGVSTATVSYIVNERANDRVPISDKTRQRVLDAVAELGYLPDARAQSLASGDTKTIGLIIPDIRNPHFWEHAEGVGQEARAAGYHILLSETGLDTEYEEDIFKDLMINFVAKKDLPTDHIPTIIVSKSARLLLQIRAAKIHADLISGPRQATFQISIQEPLFFLRRRLCDHL